MTAKQKKLLTFMLHGYNRTQLLALVQIDSNTYSRWLKEPHFKKALEKLTDEFDLSSSVEVRALLMRTWERLGLLLDSKDEQVALGASRTIIDAHTKLIQAAEDKAALRLLEDRLEQVQAVAAARQLPESASDVIQAEIVVGETDLVDANGDSAPDSAPKTEPWLAPAEADSIESQ